MQSFQQVSNFLTDLKSIDDQHQKVADLVDQIGEQLSNILPDKNIISQLVIDLTKHALYHFKEEERLMSQYRVDTRHLSKHTKIHHKFITDLTSIYPYLDIENRGQSSIYFKYLSLCIQHHMLMIDKDMASQIKNIQSGMTPEQAYYQSADNSFNISESLIDVMYDLFIHLETQRKELKDLNESLEEKVETRTQALSESNAHLKKLSLTDPLTNISNRRHAIQTLSKLWQQAKQTDQPLTCFIIDVDNFKKINDDYGHDTGDIVLTELTEAINKQLSREHLLCRLGGDEFILICSNTDKPQAQLIADSILRKARELKVKNHIEEWFCSVSIGGASRKTDMMGYENLIKAADNALYAAKSAGKNCIRFAE